MTHPARILEVTAVTKQFGGVVACKDIRLSVTKGEIVGIIGPNGAGKTTLFNCIAGAHRPDAGEIEFEGKRIERLSPERRTRRGIARTFQNMRPFVSISLLDNVAVAALSHERTVKRARAHAAEVIDYVGLSDKRHALAGELSTGQRKRLELARAIATKPRLLLMDEVTGGVDQATIPGLLELVQRLRADGMTLLVIEHNMDVIRKISDRLVAMHFGEVIADGDPRDVVANTAVIDSYLGVAHA